MQQLKDEVGNYRYVSEGTPWPSWKKGEQKREAILKLLEENPNISIAQIANSISLSPLQVRRHRARLISDCLWKVCLVSIVLGSTFMRGAYWANQEVFDEVIEELVHCAIDSAIDWKEDAVWSIEQNWPQV